MPKYKSQWKPNSKNEEFWSEVLMQRTIVGIVYNDKGIDHLVLDSGECLYTSTENTFHIKEEVEL